MLVNFVRFINIFCDFCEISYKHVGFFQSGSQRFVFALYNSSLITTNRSSI